MKSHTGEAGKLFETLASTVVNIDMISTSEIKISATLRAGGALWIVGGINDVKDTNPPVSLPPPPLRASGWNETPYRITWNNQFGWFVRRHATNLECLDNGFAEDVNLNERVSFWKVTGWTEK